MGSTVDFVQYIIEQIDRPEQVTARKMFGEYALYYDGKVFALVCDNQLFIKPTDAGRDFIGDTIDEAPPYPGARNHFLISDGIDKSEWVQKLADITAAALPLPKKKRRKTT